VIIARYSGKCPGCGERIEEGDPLGKVDGDWCCEVCVNSHGEDEWERDDG
jgi:hypothetical protein